MSFSTSTTGTVSGSLGSGERAVVFEARAVRRERERGVGTRSMHPIRVLDGERMERTKEPKGVVEEDRIEVSGRSNEE